MPAAVGTTSATTDVTMAAGVAGKKLRCSALRLHSAAAVEARVYAGTSGGTLVVDPQVDTNGFVWEAKGDYLFETGTGEAITLDLQTAVRTSYSVEWVEITG